MPPLNLVRFSPLVGAEFLRLRRAVLSNIRRLPEVENDSPAGIDITFNCTQLFHMRAHITYSSFENADSRMLRMLIRSLGND